MQPNFTFQPDDALTHDAMSVLEWFQFLCFRWATQGHIYLTGILAV